jgi:hypothetical protein
MQFAVSHDPVPTDLPAAANEPSPAKQRRVAATTTLLAVAICAILAKGHLIEAATPSHNAALALNAGTAPVTIVAPEFCKDQTWPYIDSRCLRRVDNPAPAAPQATVAPAAPATTAVATPAPSGVSANTVAAATPPTAAPTEAQPTVAQPTVAQPTVAQPTVAQPTIATNAPPAAAAPNPTDTRDQVMQSVFPAAAPDTRTYPATNAYTRAANASQRRRSEHWNNQSGFFGFRF